MAQLKIRLLGSFQVNLGATPVTKFESNKVLALLAYLAVESDRAHNREKLAELLWPEMPAKRANANLSRALYILRRLVHDHQAESPYLIRSLKAVQFNQESDYQLDVKSFRERLSKAKIIDHPHRIKNQAQLENIQAAVDLYRGDFLEGLAFDSSLNFDEWVLVVRQRLQCQALQALHLLADDCAERGKIAKALPYAWRQVELDPLGEAGCHQLMELLADSDQRSQALTQFERLRVMLAEELSVAPETETVALRDQIRGDDGLHAQHRGAGDNLPALLTPLIGRQNEMTELQALIGNSDCRLLTILGPGGSGKTRLALEIARSWRINFSHGVYFVPLNPVQSPESILPTIADALELSLGDQDDPQAQIVNYLRNKNILLVLDGFEHLLDGRKVLADILHQADGFKLLITSRTRLNIKSEHLYILTGMHFPQQAASQAEILDSDAVQLLVTGLQRIRTEYQPGSEDIEYLHKICQKVQGMPLGILLAASWGATLSVEEIAGEVNRGLDFLAADWADVPARQRSLRATFDHTWKLLSEREQTIFQSLSVFRGGFSRRAALVVSGASPHELRNLVDRSLLWSKTPGWYEVHELLRQYGRERLAQFAQVEQDVCCRHSEYYLGQLGRLGDDLKTSQQVAALSRIDLEHENYRAAWNWAAGQGDAGQLVLALEPLCLYYDLSFRYKEGESACRLAAQELSLVQASGEGQLLQTSILTWQSRFTRLLGQPGVARPFLDQAQVQLEKARVTGVQVCSVEAFLALEKGNNHFHNDRAAAASCYHYSLQFYRDMEDAWGAAQALAGLGLIAHHAGSFEEAVQRYSECLAQYRALGDPRGIANALVELGHNTLRQGKVSAGQGYIQEGTAILKQIGDRAGAARGDLEFGRSCFWAGQFAKGNAKMLKSVPILEDLGMRGPLAFSVTALSLGLSHLGNYVDAGTQAMKGLPLAKELDARREIAMAYLLLGKACLGQGDFEQTQAWALKSIAQYQEIDQKDELGWALALMIFVERDLNRAVSAESYICQTLEIGIKTHGYVSVLHGLCAAALLFLDQGEIERAIELIALVWGFPVAANSHWFEDVAGREISAAAETLPPEVVAAAQKRGQERDIWETAAELLEELKGKDIDQTELPSIKNELRVNY